ncbi:hypothetical protein [Methylorubrum salsuginis]|uniref:Uncharacterized protein n=1 Tax=Methylorubrum salsuginis TaxID=414703 RepID=A0A1I4FL50_9HYPH|nr:hypothetical protein [Methylorubrum salsuginis]SFL18060.1 hypothetical protein SAMN04488125_11073 [Methylorubrum salsuginis]
MQTAANLANPLVGALVKHAERRTGSRMLAYEAVGRTIGTTASWVRKFIGNQPVRLDADVFLRIRATYQANCDRWDAQADEDRAAFFALGEADDAMDSVAPPGGAVAKGANAARGRQASAVVAPLVDEGGR